MNQQDDGNLFFHWRTHRNLRFEINPVGTKSRDAAASSSQEEAKADLKRQEEERGDGGHTDTADHPNQPDKNDLSF